MSSKKPEVRTSAPAPAEFPGILTFDELRDSPFQPRTDYAEADLAELTESIRKNGLLQPPLVRPINGVWDDKASGWDADHFEIVCGHRRVRAAQAAGLKEIAVMVRPLDDMQVRAAQDAENAKRADISISDRAMAMATLRDSGLTVAQIADMTSTKESSVREFLLLSKMPTNLVGPVNDGIISPSAAVLVCRIPDAAKQVEAAAKVVDGGYTHEQTRNLIASKYQRELKSAPFPTKGEKAKRFALQIASDKNESPVCCEGCPNRAGVRAEAEPEYKAVRADICLDTACYAYRERIWKELHPPVVAKPDPKPAKPTQEADEKGYFRRIAVEAAKRSFDKLKAGVDSSSRILGHSDRLVAYLLHDQFAQDYALSAAMNAVAGKDPGEWLEDADYPSVRAFSASVAVASIAVNHPAGSALPIGKTFAGLLGVDPDKFREQVKADVDAEGETNKKSKAASRKGAA